ncbi:MAG: GTP-binding protein [Lachnospiraceae bacterium]|nr:GTP-binding protein [Lachnospiraceae bacterium]
MEDKPEIRPPKYINMGILAHVDAGKTTLAEGILYTCGKIRQAGRVDHGNAFLDTYAMERARGITIFSKQARLGLGDLEVTLLDTPGHADFSAEMERTLQVMDYAILVISGADGVQAQAETLWRLLKRYEVPVFLFVNKMDQPGTDRVALMKLLKERLGDGCVYFGPDQPREEWLEELAVCEEGILEKYLDSGEVSEEEIGKLVRQRHVFPCFFGSALRLEGIRELLEGIRTYVQAPEYPGEFGARVFKIGRDEQGNRLTYLKVTGGSLKVKMPLTNRKDKEAQADSVWEEKADQIRLYSGAGFELAQEARAGMVCAVTGLSRTYAGEGLGIEQGTFRPVLEPVLTYEVRLPEGCDVHGMLQKLRQLEEEEPMLHVIWQEQTGEIHAQVMGTVQMEVLKSQILERFGVEVEFGSGTIVYKETITAAVEGVGHFEPLRHYAEVHLLLEPGEPGSGLQFDTRCSEDQLDRNWQRLILTHLMEKSHRGVLIGAPITDMRITLLSGKAHVKHTEGGDFRQATYRAVRQGLRSASSILLEPIYAFRLEIPGDKVGRAMADMQRMKGSVSPPVLENDRALLTGCVPVAALGEYAREVASYTRGMGRLSCTLQGYAPCHNEEEVRAACSYDPEGDLENPTGSVFCAHGAGFVVPWDQVREYMHLDSAWQEEQGEAKSRMDLKGQERPGNQEEPRSKKDLSGPSFYDDKELQDIFERTYGPVSRSHRSMGAVYVGTETPGRGAVAGSEAGATQAKEGSVPGRKAGSSTGVGNRKDTREEIWKERRGKKSGSEEPGYLLVDGYNIIFAWEELAELAGRNLEAARGLLMDLLCDYQGFRGDTLILVFDAYKVKGNPGEVTSYHNIHVVYTREAETADQYIEKTVHEIGRKHKVTVATSDALEQVIILGQGARRMSAQGLREELTAARIEIRQVLGERRETGKNTLFAQASRELREQLEQLRLGKRSEEET